MAQVPTSKDDVQALIASISDAAKSYDANADSITAYYQRAAIREAAKELINAVSTPNEYTDSTTLTLCATVMMRTAIRLGVFEAIPIEGSISRADLARDVGATESLIDRMMRILVATKMFDQTEEGSYRHTRFSLPCIDTSVPGPGTYFLVNYDMFLRCMINFDDFMVDTAKGGVHDEPTSNYVNPFTRRYGKDGQGTWEVMGSMPELLRVFQVHMGAIHRFLPPRGPSYDFAQFKTLDQNDDRAQLVDVAGGSGSVICEIITATPELDPAKCFLQDIESVIDIADTAKALGIQTQVIDFHKEQPIRDAKAYYLRFITHDYQDPAIINILSHISNAMSSDSRLLLNDFLLVDRLTEATLPVGLFDQYMLTVGGKERTKEGFEYILGKAGLEILEIHRVPGSSGCIIECIKVGCRDKFKMRG